MDSGERVKVLVTGATGFVASHLIPVLAKDHDVVALGHEASRIPAGDGIEPLVLDLRQATEARLPPADAIVHLAQANVPFPDGAVDLHAVNTAATVALLDHARSSGAHRFVFASSASVYGFRDQAWSEDEVPAATDFYSMTKLSAERFARTFEEYLGVTILRFVAPYGPGQRNRMIPRLVESVREGRPVTLNEGGRPRMNPIYVADVVRLIKRAVDSQGNHLVNVAGDDAATIEEICLAIGAAIGVKPEFEQGSGKAGELVCENRRMKEAFGLDDLVSLAAGLAKTANA
jgi:nucleoside-diphosphate-sugar epimerase